MICKSPPYTFHVNCTINVYLYNVCQAVFSFQLYLIESTTCMWLVSIRGRGLGVLVNGTACHAGDHTLVFRFQQNEKHQY